MIKLWRSILNCEMKFVLIHNTWQKQNTNPFAENNILPSKYIWLGFFCWAIFFFQTLIQNEEIDHF